MDMNEHQKEIIRDALENWGTEGEYDSPGGPPELCGWRCLMCKESAATLEEIKHGFDCPLSVLDRG